MTQYQQEVTQKATIVPTVDSHLQNTKDLYGNKLAALDGEIGQVKDFYFDDNIWVVRYAIADTGSWLTGRLVLLSPHAFGKLDQYEKTLHINLRKAQIQDSPSIESHKPVSRQYEVEYYRYYGWPAYWAGDAMWGMGGYPVLVPPAKDEIETQRLYYHRDDKHLQSTREVTGYPIEATDGRIGHVTGFLVDDRSWAIRELVVEAGHWYSGKEIRIPSSQVERISYKEMKVFVNLSKADIDKTAEHAIVKSNGGRIQPHT
ncbi:MAG TPA: PRC-barrel domain-containing protein [Polyangia bacterium]